MPAALSEIGTHRFATLDEIEDAETREMVEEVTEELQAERRRLLQSGAKLAALYGSFGIFDNIRKSRVELAQVAAKKPPSDGTR